MNELGHLYESKSDEELLLIYSESDELTPDAREVLKVEMNRRGLTEREAEDFQESIEFEDRRQAKQDQSKRLNNGGKRWFGKTNVVSLPATSRQRFDTTFFIFFIYLPVVPLGSYRIERLKKGWREKIIVLEKLPLNWEQVLRAWIVTGAVFLAVLWASKLWIYFQFKH